MSRNKSATKKKPPASKTYQSAVKKAADIRSIIVLAVCAVIFLVALFYLHSDSILSESGEMFNPYGKDELVEFENGKVNRIVSEEMQPDEDADGAYTGMQELEVTIRTGRYKGETMTIYNYFGPLTGVPVSVGNNVIVTIKIHTDGVHTGTVYEYNRIPIIAGFLLLFFIVVFLIGGRTGIKSLVGLVFTVICLFAILIPLLLLGAPTIPATFAVCAYIALVCFTIIGGIHRKTISAFLGTVSGTFFAMVFGIVVQYIAKIDGLRLEDAEPLLQLKYAGLDVRVKGLLVAGIIICALGAVMDVAMSISSALEEVHAANPSLTRGDLFRSGMNIGRDMVGTMTNTLILAFLGGEFTLIVFFYSRELSFRHMFSTAFVALETISGLSSSIGMILSIPLTALISSALITRKN